MTLTQARALYADVAYQEHHPDEDCRALEALGRWMMRFSPIVAIAPEDSAIFLDITGCERVFNGFKPLLDRLCDALIRLHIEAHIASAPTPGAAWALAYSGVDRAIVKPSQVEAALDVLPIEALRVGSDIAASLKHLGLHTIGQVLHLPRQVLPARFGPMLLRRIDQALGWVAEPLVPLEYRTPIEAKMDLDGAVTSLEAIWSMFQSLLGKIIEQLAHRGQGARRLEIELLKQHAPPVKKTILLSRPSRDPVNFFNLFRCSLEELQLPLKERRSKHFSPSPGTAREGWGGGQFSGAKTATSVKKPPPRPSPGVPGEGVNRTDAEIFDEGFSGLRITVPLCESLTDEQISLLGQEQFAGQLELDRLIERLCVRLGNEAIFQAEMVESHVPELSWTRKCDSASAPSSRQSSRRVSRPAGDPAILASAARPLHLLPLPREIRVMVTPSEDAEGTPISFNHNGTVRQVVHLVGPERITGRWWTGHDKTRDYFDVGDPKGQRFWIFRVRQTRKWYLHGVFE
jgi:protein ImuB